MKEIALLTVCTDDYPMVYAQKIIKRFIELTDYQVQPYCITDRPNELDPFTIPIEPPFGSGYGWWNKMKAYDLDIAQQYVVYLDIDNVLQRNFDEEIDYSIQQLKNGFDIACVSDAIMWKNNKYSSSMMILEKGKMRDVWDTFVNNPQFDFDGGDQVYTGAVIFRKGKKVFYIDETFPDLKLNLKFHLSNKVLGQWKFPSYLPPKCKIVDCGGRPKPHDLGNLKYIKENWHDVE